MLAQTLPAGADDRTLVNKRVLATRVLKCALPTVDSLIDRYPDFPIEQRGSNGIEWQFDAEAVVRFLEAKRQAERDAAAQRDELLRQFSLPIDEVASEETHGLSPSQRESLAKARIAERKLAMESGMLVSTAEMRQTLTGALSRLGRFLDTLPGQVAKAHGLPDEVARAMRNRIDDQRRAFVAELKGVLQPEGEPHA